MWRVLGFTFEDNDNEIFRLEKLTNKFNSQGVKKAADILNIFYQSLNRFQLLPTSTE